MAGEVIPALNPYQEYVNKYADMFSLDPDLLSAVMYQESRFKPDARSSVGAIGPMQLMPGTASNLGVDPYDIEQNIYGGAKLLREELDRFGDEKLALAAYNAGSPKLKSWMKQAGALSFDELKPWLEENGIDENANYPGGVLSWYSQLKAGKPTPNAPISAEAEDQQQVLAISQDREEYGTKEEFLDELEVVATSSDFANMDTAGRLRKINQIYNSRPWVSSVHGVIKSFADTVLEEDPGYVKATFDELVGPLPLGDNPNDIQKNVQAARRATFRGLVDNGVPPELFGSLGEEYFTTQEKELTARYNAKNLGYFGAGFEAVQELAKGVVSGVTTPLGALPELAGFTETAASIQEIPDALFGETNRAFAYVTDTEGNIVYDQFGKPVTKWDASILNGLGQVGGLLAGGALLKGLGYGARGIAAFFGGTETLSIADQAYKYTTQEGGTHGDGVKAAVLAMPLGAVATVADLVTTGFARPWVQGLTQLPLNKVNAVAQAINDATPLARIGLSGAAGALVQGGEEAGVELGTQAAAYAVTQNPAVFNKEAVQQAGVVGGIIGGGFGVGLSARQARLEQATKTQSAKQPSTSTAPEVTSEVAPEPAASGRQIAGLLPPPERFGTSPIPIEAFDRPSAQEQIAIAQQFEAFQLSPEFEKTFTIRNIKDVPVELLEMMGYEAQLTAQNKLAVRKVTTHVPVQVADEINALDTRIEQLETEALQNPSPFDAQGLMEEKLALEQDVQRTVVDGSVPELTPLYRERRDLLTNVTQLNRQVRKAKDPVIKQQLETRLADARATLSNFDSNLLSRLPKSLKRKGLQIDPGTVEYLQKRARLEEVSSQLKRMQTPTYVNDVQAKEIELASLLTRRQEVSKQVTFVREGPPILERGVRVEGNDQALYVIPSDKGWYVTDDQGNGVIGARTFFGDAIKAAQSFLEPRKPVQITPVSNDPNISGGEPVQTTQVDQAPPKSKGRPKKKTKLRKLEDGTFTTLPEGAQGLVTEDKQFSKVQTPRTDKYFQPARANYIDNSGTFVETEPFETRELAEPVSVKEVYSEIDTLLTQLGDHYSYRIGGPIPEGVRGYFSTTKKYIRIAQGTDLPAAVHEASHAIDAALLENTELPENLVDALETTASLYYPDSSLKKELQRTEGFAMFVQNYVTRNPVHRDVLNWWNTDFQQQHPEAHKLVENIKSAYELYRVQTPQQRLRAHRSAKRPSQGLIPRLYRELKRALYDNFQQLWVDNAIEAKRFDKLAAEARKKLAAEGIVQDVGINELINTVVGNARETARYNVTTGFSDLNGNIFPGQLSLSQIMKPVLSRYSELSDYMVAKRAIAYDKQGKESGFEINDALDTARRYELSEDQSIARAAEQIWQWTDNIMEAVARRTPFMRYVVDKLRAANLEDTGVAHGFYVPFAREGFEGLPRFGKSTTGSTRAISDPIQHLSAFAENIFYVANKRFVQEQLMALAQPTVSAPVGMYIAKVSPERNKQLNEELDEVLKAEGISAEGDELLFMKETAMLFAPNRVVSRGADGYSIYMFPNNKGQPEFYEVKDELLASFDITLPDFTKSLWWQIGATIPRNLVRSGAVGLNVIFPFKALVSYDFMTLYRNANETWNPLKLGWDVANALISATLPKAGIRLKQGNFADMRSWVDLSQRLGVTSATSFRAATINEDIQISTGLKVVDATLKSLRWFEDLLSTAEEAPRITAMRYKAKELGITDPNAPLTSAQAIALASAYKYGTTNFGVQGQYARMVNQVLPFFTARLASMSQLPRDIRQNPRKHAALALGMLSYGIAKGLSDSEDERMQQLPPEVLLHSTIIPVTIGGEEKALRIPLETFSAIPHAVGYGIAQALQREDVVRPKILEWLSAFAKNQLPIDPFSLNSLPPALKIPAEIIANKSFYANRPIVPDGLKYEAPQHQFTQYTTATAKELGELTGISPLKLEHVMRGIFPASMDYIRFVERKIGTEESKSRAPTNLLEEAYMYYEPPEAFDDRGSQLFYEAYNAALANKAVENEDEKAVRLKLEKIKRNLSDIRTLLSSQVDDKEVRSKLFETKRNLLEEGILLANDMEPKQTNLIPGLKAKADRLRAERKKTLQESKSDRL